MAEKKNLEYKTLHKLFLRGFFLKQRISFGLSGMLLLQGSSCLYWTCGNRSNHKSSGAYCWRKAYNREAQQL